MTVRQPRARASARSTSPATRRSSWRRRPTISRIRRSASCFVETEYLADSAALLCHRRPRDPREPAAWAVHVAEPRRPAAGAGRMGDRSRALPRPRPRHRRPGRARRPRAVGHDRHRARSDRQPAPADPAGAGRVGAALVSPPASPRIARPPRRWRRSTATRAPPRARSRSPSRTRRAACAIWASRPTRRCCSSAWRRACSFADGSLRAGAGDDRRERARPGRPVAARHLRRSADPARARRRRRRRAAGAPGAAGAGVLAPEGAERRRRHPQRASGRATWTRCTRSSTALLDDGPWRTWKHRSGGAYLLRGDRMGEAERDAARGGRARGPRAATAATCARQLDTAASGPGQPARRRSLPTPRRTRPTRRSPPGDRAAADDADQRPRRVHRRRARPTRSSSRATRKRRCRG